MNIKKIIGNSPLTKKLITQKTKYDVQNYWKNLVRITKKHLITMAHEEGTPRKNFPRNYKTVFEKLGLKQVDSFKLEKGYVCRIFAIE